jgi:hypothetical protein
MSKIFDGQQHKKRQIKIFVFLLLFFIALLGFSVANISRMPSAKADSISCIVSLDISYDEVATLTQGEVLLVSGETAFLLSYEEESTCFVSTTAISAGDYDLYIDNYYTYYVITIDGTTSNYEINLITYSYNNNGAESGSLPFSGCRYIKPLVEISVDNNSGCLAKTGYYCEGFNLSGETKPVQIISSSHSFILYAVWFLEEPQATFTSSLDSFIYGDFIEIFVSHPLIDTETVEISYEWYENDVNVLNSGNTYMPNSIGTVTIGCTITLNVDDEWVSKYFEEEYIFEAKTLEISWATDQNEEYLEPFVYDGIEHTVVPCILNKVCTTDDVNIIVDVGAQIIAGNYTLGLEIAGDKANLYSFAQGEDTFNYSIDKAILTDNTENINEIYNSQEFSVNFSFTGFAGMESLESLKNSNDCSIFYSSDGEEYSDTALQWKDEGSYQIFYCIVFTNYQTVEGNRSVFISPLDIDVKIEDISSNYGDELLPLMYTVNSIIYDSTDNLNITLTKEEGTDADIYMITGQCGNSNYNVSFMSGIYTIEKRELDIRIEDKISFYGDDLLELSFILLGGVGIVDGDNLNINLEKSSGDTVGIYDITGIWDNDNYNVEFTNGSYSIVPAEVTLEINDVYVFYGQSEVVLSYMLTSGKIVTGDELITLYRDEGDQVGEYLIMGECTNSNYLATIINGLYVIKPIEITVYIHNESTLYGEPLEELEYEITDGAIVENDNFNIYLNMACDNSAGTFPINGICDNSNYNVNFISGEYVITPIELTVEIYDAASIYGEEIAEFSCEIVSGTPKENEDLQIVITKDDGLDVGVYALKGNCYNTNYSVAFMEGQYTISKTSLTDNTAYKQSKIYDGTLKTVSYDIVGFAYSDSVYDGTAWYSYTGDNDYTTEIIGIKNVSDSGKTIYYKLEFKNYYSLSGSVEITVEKCQLTIQIDDKSSKEGESLAELTYTIVLGAVASSDDLGMVMSKESGSSVGKYAINGNISNNNYNAVVLSGEYTITIANVVSQMSVNETITEVLLTCDEGFEPGLSFEIINLTDENLEIMEQDNISGYNLISAISIECKNIDGNILAYDGFITVKISIPDGVDGESIMIYEKLSDGTLVDTKFTIIDEFIVFYADINNEYIFVQNKNASNIIVFVVFTAVISVCILGMFMSFNINKKRFKKNFL